MAVATILAIVVLSILLPTADVFTDINLAVKLYKPPPGCEYWQSRYDGDMLWGVYDECLEDPATFCSRDENRQHCKFYDPHYKMATVLLMPFFLNYIVCFYTFFRQTTYRKRYTFIFPLLNLYPQYEAAKLIYSIYKDEKEGKKKKKEYDQNIGLHEVFLESVPTALIITVIWLKSGMNILIIHVTVSRQCPMPTLIGYGTFIDGAIEFFITFFLSWFSASLGLAKCLKNGVARTIGDGGCLDGLLSCRHLLAYFACGLCLGAKGACLGFVSTGPSSYELLLSIFLLFVPQCLLAIFSTLNLRSKSSLKIITHHPSLILLPIFTFFTFSKVKVFSYGSEPRVMFSKTFTWVNMAVSVVGYVVWCVSFYHRIQYHYNIIVIIFITLSLLLLSIILTLLLLHLDRLCWGCSWTRVPEEVTSVYDPTTDKRMILENGELVEPPEDDVEAYEMNILQFF